MSAPVLVISDLSDEQLVTLALASGWTADTASLYDEEAVDGWRWESPDSITDLSCIGDWDQPCIDDTVRAAMVDDLTARGIAPSFSL